MTRGADEPKGHDDTIAAVALDATVPRTATVTDTGDARGPSDPLAPTVAGPASARPRGIDDWVGRTIGRYRIERRLGSGGMGVVWAALDPALDRRVALKVLPPLDAERRAHLEVRLRREAQALARLEHPNVVAVYDVGVAAESVFVAMQLIDGATLDRHLTTAQPTPAEIIGLFGEACRGLAAAHAAGIVHRDVKPSNLLVDKAGRVYVGDFGLARGAADDDDTPAPDHSLLSAEMTRAGAVMGTPLYMAPEQHAGEAATARSDQYSLCVSLWEALFGQHPFAAARWEHDAALAAMRADRIVEPPRRRGVPAGVVRALRRGLRFDPAARWDSVEELAEAIAPRGYGGWIAAGAGAVGIAGAVALTLGLTTGGATPLAACRAKAHAMHATWPGQADTVARAFAATGRADAGALSDRSRAALDDYARRWVDLRVEACDAHAARAEVGPEVATMHLRCLDDNGRAFREVVDELATGRNLGRALDTVRALPALERCATPLLAVQPVPGPAIAAEVSTTRATLDRASRLRKTDQLREARALVDEVAPRAEALGYAPLVAELRLEQALLAWDVDVPRARVLLEQAAEQAAACRHELVAATALKLQIVQAAQASDQRRFDALIPQARAAAQRTDDPKVEAEVAIAVGVAWKTAGRFAEAGALCADALAKLGPSDDQRVQAYSCLAQVASGKGDLPAAEATITTQLELLEARDGPDARAMVTPLDQLTTIRRRQLRIDDALAIVERSRAIIVRVDGEHSRSLILNDVLAARLLRDAKRWPESIARAEHALALAHDLDVPPGALTVAAEVQLAQTLRAAERYDEMKPHFENALALARTALAANDNSLLEAQFGYATYLNQSRQFDQALAIYDDLATSMRARADGRLAAVLAQRAAVIRDRDGCAPALEPFEEAVAALRRNGNDARNLVVAQAALAECLWDTKRDRPRARTAMLEVRAMAASGGTALAAVVAEADAWLATHR